tara:strand:- start:1539 stop:2003 length:465 start_codon:yes stop_codon:yes gene_type:complete
MVLPAVPVAVYIIGATATAVGTYLLLNSDGVISEVTEDIANQAIDAGADVVEGTLQELLPILQSVGSDIAEGLGDLGEDILGASMQLGNQTLQVIRGAIPAVIDGIDDGYDYVRNKISGNEPTIIASLTVGMLSVLAGIYLINAARRGTMTYKQ